MKLFAVLLLLHGPGGQPVEVNAGQIVSLRPPRVGTHFSPGTGCLVFMTDGKFIAVRENCPEISRMIEAEPK